MAIYSLNARQIVFISVSVFGAAILFFALQGSRPQSFHLPGRGGSNEQGKGWKWKGKESDDLLRHVQNQTLGFQKIFVISLASRTDHRDAMSLSAALTGLQIEYVDGVTEMVEKALPPGGKDANLEKGALFNWRAHMDVARMIVDQNITSALVLEDDADWDIRLKSQLQDFALATRLLVQPLPPSVSTDPLVDQFLDPSHPKPSVDQEPETFDSKQHTTSLPTSSPYGDIDRWDLLWLGHCGTHFPSAADKNVPIGRAAIYDDATVPEQQHVQMQFGNSDLVNEYPPHTRVVSRAWANVCTLGYALSQPGARRLLYDMGISKLNAQTDLAMRSMCDGLDNSNGKKKSRVCVTVQPQIFQHHRPKGSKVGFSDIDEGGKEGQWNEKAYTRNVRWSVKLNMAGLVDGVSESEYVDLFKDGEAKDDSLGFY